MFNKKMLKKNEHECARCNKYLKKDFFGNKKLRKGIYCLNCSKEARKEKDRSKEGIIRVIYHAQVQACKLRNHPPPSYTIIELKNWISSHKDFLKLYNNWVKSNYDKWLKPSIDRLNNKKTYSLDNIRLVTWKINYESELNKNLKEYEFLSNGKRKMKKKNLGSLK